MNQFKALIAMLALVVFALATGSVYSADNTIPAPAQNANTACCAKMDSTGSATCCDKCTCKKCANKCGTVGAKCAMPAAKAACQGKVAMKDSCCKAMTGEKPVVK